MKTKFRNSNVILTEVVNVCYTHLGNKPLYICIRESILQYRPTLRESSLNLDIGMDTFRKCDF